MKVKLNSYHLLCGGYKTLWLCLRILWRSFCVWVRNMSTLQLWVSKLEFKVLRKELEKDCLNTATLNASPPLCASTALPTALPLPGTWTNKEKERTSQRDPRSTWVRISGTMVEYFQELYDANKQGLAEYTAQSGGVEDCTVKADQPLQD